MFRASLESRKMPTLARGLIKEIPKRAYYFSLYRSKQPFLKNYPNSLKKRNCLRSGAGFIELTQNVLGQLQLDGVQDLVELLDASGAGDRGTERRLRKQPGQ